MEATKQTNPICKSVFKSGESTISPQQFTRQWIDLINKVEGGKGVKFEHEK